LRFSLSHWVQGSPLPPAAQAIIIFFATFLIGSYFVATVF
jgi:hypothetical protein